MPIAHKDYSGEISCDGSLLCYRSAVRAWSIKVSTIRLVGEYTTGSWGDDYFLVFLTARENGWYEASFYAKGRDEALDVLGKSLGEEMQLGLCNSTHFKSRVVWPSRLRDKELVDLVPNKSAFRRFRQKWLGASVEFKVSDVVLSVFAE